MRAAEKGDVFAQGYLADIFETSSTRADYRKGYHWTLKAALQGDDNAVVRLQTIYVHRDEVTTFEAALEKLSRGGDQGDANAQWQLASVLLMGTTGHKDEARAKVLAEKSAAQNSPEGMRVMSFLVASGDNIPTETETEARMYWLRKAADLGHVPAQLDWIMFYEAPLGVDRTTDPNERLIFDWLVAAAEKGWPMAQRSLPQYYRDGSFVAQDPAEAWKWRLLAQHQPYRRRSAWDGEDPWARADEDRYEVEGRRRAKAWLDAHPLQYWQVEK
jgi:TPR repeat protein